MTGCSACDSGLGVPGTSGGGKRNRRRSNRMRGGAHLSLSPASLTGGDSFDRNGPALSKAAHATYINDSLKLASIKNVNAMAGGGKRGRSRSRTAKKYRSKSKSQRGGIMELGSLAEAVVPFSLLAAQQKYFKRRGTKGYKGRKSRKFRGSRRR